MKLEYIWGMLHFQKEGPFTTYQLANAVAETKSLWGAGCCGKGMWLRTIIVSANYGMLSITSHKYYFYDVYMYNIVY